MHYYAIRNLQAHNRITLTLARHPKWSRICILHISFATAKPFTIPTSLIRCQSVQASPRCIIPARRSVRAASSMKAGTRVRVAWTCVVVAACLCAVGAYPVTGQAQGRLQQQQQYASNPSEPDLASNAPPAAHHYHPYYQYYYGVPGPYPAQYQFDPYQPHVNYYPPHHGYMPAHPDEFASFLETWGLVSGSAKSHTRAQDQGAATDAGTAQTARTERATTGAAAKVTAKASAKATAKASEVWCTP